ncbi:MAG: DNA polymerase III subunit chi [Desulfuromonas sp.]|nr:MAG: DNA polymerase III subunit chi [Desulfuromonas sp.]
MPTIRFVKLKKPEKAKHLCLLAEKYFSEGKRVLLTVSDDNQGVTLDRFMWTYSKGAFLPHAYDNGSVECFDEPVVITLKERNCNNAQVLIMGAPCSLEFVRRFEQVVDFAELYDDSLAEAARERFRQYREAGFAPDMHE